MAPAILVTMGVLFLLGEFGGWRLNFDHTWPMLLIVIGAVILARRNASIEGHLDPAQPYVMLQQPVAPQPQATSPNHEVHNG
jgi:hypothetical protein